MGVGAFISGFEVVDYFSVAFGTAIVEPISAQDGARLAFLSGAVTCAGTAQILSFMFARDLAGQAGSSRNTSSAAAAPAATHIFTTVAPKDPLGNAAATPDVIAYQCTDGTWEFNLVSSLAGSDITLTTPMVKGINSGAKVLILGVVGDGASLKLNALASVQNKWGGAAGANGIVLAHPYVGEPFYVYDPNATATTSMDFMLFGHINK